MLEDVETDLDNITIRTQKVIDGRLLPPCYYVNSIALEHGSTGTTLPGSIFLDGVSCSQHDSVTGKWLVNLLDGRRHLCVTTRKKTMRECGYRGWCI